MEGGKEEAKGGRKVERGGSRWGGGVYFSVLFCFLGVFFLFLAVFWGGFLV